MSSRKQKKASPKARKTKLLSDIPDIELYYKRLARKFPLDTRSDGYSHPVSQIVRYDAYMTHLRLDESTVLDVGCGTGEFLRYMTNKGIYPFRYVGIDLISEKIKAANHICKKTGFLEYFKKHHVKVEFRPGTIDDIKGKFHFAIACSIFDVKQTDVPTTFKLACDTMAKMWNVATEAIGVDFFSPYATDIQNFSAPIPPEWVLTWAKLNLSERVLLDFSYAPHSYMIIVVKKDNLFRQIWKESGGWEREKGGEEEDYGS